MPTAPQKPLEAKKPHRGVATSSPVRVEVAEARRRRRAIPFSEWCLENGFSDSTGYRMLQDGTGPRTYKVRKTRFVDDVDGEEWLRERKAEEAAREAQG